MTLIRLMGCLDAKSISSDTLHFIVDNPTHSKMDSLWTHEQLSSQQIETDTNVLWGDLDFMLIDLPPGTGDIHLSLVQSIPVGAAIVVSTPQNIALADARKGVAMFQMDSINVPVLGLVENMSYFTPEELPNNKYYIFGKEGAKALADRLELPLLAEIPLVQSIREAADVGRPAVLQGATPAAMAFMDFADKVVLEMNKRNALEPTKRVEITNMNGCST